MIIRLSSFLMRLSLLIQPKSAGRGQSLKAHANTKQLFWPHSAVHENCYSFYLFIKKIHISFIDAAWVVELFGAYCYAPAFPRKVHGAMKVFMRLIYGKTETIALTSTFLWKFKCGIIFVVALPDLHNCFSGIGC